MKPGRPARDNEPVDTGRRTYDVVLFGATGFTGRQAVSYFIQHAPPALRWAIAGRSREKLDALGAPVDLLVADSSDQASIDAMVSATRVVLSTAGPYALYGTPVVDACVRFHTHYVDITGETFWVRNLIERYHARAAADRVRIVPFCGFDSVPSDLGAFLMARQHGASTVRAYFEIHGGGVNGGTLASAAHLATSGHARETAPADGIVMPRYDAAIGTWVGPFAMAPVNTWVVRRSAAIFAEWGEPYPDGFDYREFMKFTPPLAAVKAVGGTAALAAVGAVLRVPPLVRALARVLPPPGSGPSESRMDKGWFSCDVIGRTAPGAEARLLIKNRGDAGNRSTVKMACESALCLALGECGDRGGVLTPATAFGDRLVHRLRAAGMTLSPKLT